MTNTPTRIRIAIGGIRVRGLGIGDWGLGFRVRRLPHRTFAPEGRRSVATGGALPAAKRAKRNPWTGSLRNSPAPEGRRKLHSTCIANAEEQPQLCSAYRALVNSTRESFAPPGAKGDDGPVFHGFRVGLLRSRAAPPVATVRRPSGAEAHHVGARANSGNGNE